MVLTLDIHHIEYVSEGGRDVPENLLTLCPNCHALHHQGKIPLTSLRTWKLLLLALNEGFDRRSIDTLLALDTLGVVSLWGDGILACAPLVASGLVTVVAQRAFVQEDPFPFHWFDPNQKPNEHPRFESPLLAYMLQLSPKGRAFLAAWKQGDQDAAIHLRSADQ